jgi:hypothetical protein
MTTETNPAPLLLGDSIVETRPHIDYPPPTGEHMTTETTEVPPIAPIPTGPASNQSEPGTVPDVFLVTRETLGHLLDCHEEAAASNYLYDHDDTGVYFGPAVADSLLSIYRALGRDPLPEDYALRPCGECGKPLANLALLDRTTHSECGTAFPMQREGI